MVKKKFKTGDKVKIVAGKHMGKTGEHRSDTDKGKDMGHVTVAGDMYERKLWKMPIEKSSHVARSKVQKKKFNPGDKVMRVAGKCTGGMGEHRMDTETGNSMGWVMLIGDMCNKCLWKTSIEKSSDQGTLKEMAILGMHLSGMSVDKATNQNMPTANTEKNQNGEVWEMKCCKSDAFRKQMSRHNEINSLKSGRIKIQGNRLQIKRLHQRSHV
jgi:hypothetical protein